MHRILNSFSKFPFLQFISTHSDETRVSAPEGKSVSLLTHVYFTWHDIHDLLVMGVICHIDSEQAMFMKCLLLLAFPG